jgi:hypothetical protein
MRISIPVLKPIDDFTHWLSVEVEDDVAVFYLDNNEIFKTDYENLEDLMVGISLIWGEWERRKPEPEKTEA